MAIPSTPERTLERIYSKAKSFLSHVYVGNIQIPGTENTHCPSCGHLLVKREYFSAEVVGFKDGRTVCNKCGKSIQRMVL